LRKNRQNHQDAKVKTTHAKQQAENKKINAETNSHGNKLFSRTNAFHQLYHQRQQPTLSSFLESWQHPALEFSDCLFDMAVCCWRFVNTMVL